MRKKGSEKVNKIKTKKGGRKKNQKKRMLQEKRMERGERGRLKEINKKQRKR